ncbi:MAG: hypothetical protein ABSF49_10605 [Roseiarcus sp.]|jgi:hypothetical protein
MLQRRRFAYFSIAPGAPGFVVVDRLDVMLAAGGPISLGRSSA